LIVYFKYISNTSFPVAAFSLKYIFNVDNLVPEELVLVFLAKLSVPDLVSDKD
jgi:hypothetical protein